MLIASYHRANRVLTEKRIIIRSEPGRGPIRSKSGSELIPMTSQEVVPLPPKDFVNEQVPTTLFEISGVLGRLFGCAERIGRDIGFLSAHGYAWCVTGMEQ